MTSFKLSDFQKILYNDTDLSKIVFNGKTVWKKASKPPTDSRAPDSDEAGER